MNKGLIGYGLGVLTVLGVLVFINHKYPEWFIKKVTETKTVYKEVPGKDTTYCGELKLSGEFIDNKLVVTGEDSCKIGKATFTLGTKRTYKHMLMFQFVESFTKDDRGRGGSINYTYFALDRIGFTIGATATEVNLALSCGVSYLW